MFSHMLSSRVRSDEILRMSGILNYYSFTPSLLAAPFPRSLKEVIVDEVNEAGEVVTVANDEYIDGYLLGISCFRALHVD